VDHERRRHPSALRSATPSRRTILQAGALVGGLTAASVLVGCGEDAASDGASGAASAGASDGGFNGALIASFPQSDPYVAAGVPARLPYLIADQEGVPMQRIDGPVRFEVRRDGEPVGEPVEVEAHGDGVPRAYLPLAFTFDEPGIYDVVATYQGTELDGSLQVVERSAITTPMVGDVVPSFATPTTADALGVDPLCTRDTPCTFHGVSLDAALASGKPTILLVSTPAYCQTAVCGPVLDLLIEEVGDRTDVNVIHSEVYADPAAVDDLSQAALAPVPERFGLAFEPALFVIDATGRVVGRGDLVVDRAELRGLLAPVG
jgi:hypothetical protein